MEKQVEIASFVEQSVGKAIRSSKKKYEWIFFINNSKNIVEVYRSSMSGKIRVIFNNTQLHYEQKFIGDNFVYNYDNGKLSFKITQKGGSFQLIVKQKHSMNSSSKSSSRFFNPLMASDNDMSGSTVVGGNLASPNMGSWFGTLQQDYIPNEALPGTGSNFGYSPPQIPRNGAKTYVRKNSDEIFCQEEVEFVKLL